MNPYDKEYKKQLSKIGVVMLIFFGATLVMLIPELYSMIAAQLMPQKALDISYNLLYSILYFSMFFVPMLIYKKLDREYSFAEMPCKMKLSRHLPLLILAGLAINYVASYINSIAVSLMGLDMSAFFVDEYPNGYHGYHFILETIKLAIVPAFCEELLFRGLILDRLKRFGREKAILISALLFALMHQHPAQAFYTFILGLFLGYMVFESGSIWGGIILHFVNNFTQVIINAISYTNSEPRANFIIAIIELVIILSGTAAAIYYFIHHGRKNLGDPEWVFFAERELTPKYSVKGFFTPTIIVFAALSIVSMAAAFFI